MEIDKENQNKKRLGRGLNSLFSEAALEKPSLPEYPKPNKPPVVAGPSGARAPADLDPESKIWKIAIDKLVPGVYQPRRRFNKESIEQLSQSIKENGVLQPITVRKRLAGGFEIIAGERRWRAAQAAGLHEIPAIIKAVGDQEALQLAIIENVQREDLDLIEEAEGYQRLMSEFKFSQQEIADKVGKERSTVANALRLITLPNEIKDMLADKILSAGHAKVLLGQTDKPAMLRLAKECIQKEWSVRALESALKAQPKKEASSEVSNSLNLDVSTKLAQELADQIQKKLGTKTEINYKSGKGQVVLHFYSDDQLTQIYEKLNK